jgi:hypothetical protein
VCVCFALICRNFLGLSGAEEKDFLEKEEGEEQQQQLQEEEEQQQAAAGDFGNLLISFWRFIPELASKVLACAERKKKERRKLRKREGFGKRKMMLGGQ